MSRISFFGQCIFEIIPPSEYLEYGSKADGEVLIINVPAYVLDYRSVGAYMLLHGFGREKITHSRDKVSMSVSSGFFSRVANFLLTAIITRPIHFIKIGYNLALACTNIIHKSLIALI